MVQLSFVKLCYIKAHRLNEMQIHSRTAGGADGTAAIQCSLVTLPAVNKAVLG